jgi:hypothetical protein
MPYEPIIFIEVAITRGMVKRIHDIIGEESEHSEDSRVNTAIFYSINNTQNGLAGLGLGKVLIGQVVDYLRKDNDQIRNFATLSPVPGFWKRYFKPLLEGEDERFKLKAEDVISYFSKKQVARIMSESEREGESSEQFNETLLSIFSDEDWSKRDTLRKCLRTPMVKIAYHYVSEERNPLNKLLNPVANFHISNGATVSQKNVNFLANPSSRGLRESCGIMVNYIYTSSWLSQIRRSFRLFDRFEIKGVFSRDRQ